MAYFAIEPLYCFRFFSATEEKEDTEDTEDTLFNDKSVVSLHLPAIMTAYVRKARTSKLHKATVDMENAEKLYCKTDHGRC